MAGPKPSSQGTGFGDLSIKSSRCGSVKGDGTGNPAHESGKHDPIESARVPDQQSPVEQPPGSRHGRSPDPIGLLPLQYRQEVKFARVRFPALCMHSLFASYAVRLLD